MDLISRQKAKDAIDMALDHIDHVPPWVYDNLLNALNGVPSVKPTHPTPSNTLGALDCVERQKAIRNICNEECHQLQPCKWKCIAIEELEDLPSVQPRKGKWIRHTRVEPVYSINGDKTWGIKCQCNKCCFATTVVEGFGYYNFCPNCGEDMREGGSDDN